VGSEMCIRDRDGPESGWLTRLADAMGLQHTNASGSGSLDTGANSEIRQRGFHRSEIAYPIDRFIFKRTLKKNR